MNTAATPTPDRLAPYRERGFATRRAYLVDLAESYGVNESWVFALANMLGPNEDFDALVTAVEDLDGYEPC